MSSRFAPCARFGFVQGLQCADRSLGCFMVFGPPHENQTIATATQRDRSTFRRTRSKGNKEGQECGGVRICAWLGRDTENWLLRGVVR
jgi:hypothetical protein